MNRNKKKVYTQLRSKDSGTTFVAIEIKPNLALLRNRGFYELAKAQDMMKHSLEYDNKRKKTNKVLNSKVSKSLIQDDIQRKSKVNIVELSKLLINRSSSMVSVSRVSLLILEFVEYFLIAGIISKKAEQD